MIEANNCCICCGAIIPESVQYCIDCARKYKLIGFHCTRKQAKKHK